MKTIKGWNRPMSHVGGMNKRKGKAYNIPAWFLYALLICIILIVGIFIFGLKDGNDCLSSPMIYGAQKAVDAETGPIRCSCRFGNPEYAPFYFDDEEMGIDNDLIP